MDACTTPRPARAQDSAEMDDERQQRLRPARASALAPLREGGDDRGRAAPPRPLCYEARMCMGSPEDLLGDDADGVVAVWDSNRVLSFPSRLVPK